MNMMKNLLFVIIALLGMFLGGCNSSKEKSIEEKLVGQWCNPFTYQSTGELKGFDLKKGGKCAAINIPSLKLKSWKVDEQGYLIIEGMDQEEDGSWNEYNRREYIALLNSDSLRLVVNEELKLGFLYLNTKVIKQRVTPQVKSDEKK